MKRSIGFVTGAACMVVMFIAGASAQTPAKVINGGVLNGKAMSLPKPVYPESARIAGVSAAVAVNVTIDEAGTVISAEADPFDQRDQRDADGNKLDPVEADVSLREAAENAARQARFAPTLLGGQPTQVKGRIIYNFVADGSTAMNGGVVSAVKMVQAGEGGGQKVNGGVLNGRATALPAPTYPAAATAVRAEGVVNIQVLIDEMGNVINAAAVSGHPLLRAAAEKAAREAKFEPTLLNGVAIKVSGLLTYNFVLGKKEDQP